MASPKKSFVLVVLDGWGHREEREHNAILAAHTPVWNHLWRDYPHGLVLSSGEDVGLPDGQMGNSEVGHMNLGAGRVVYQDFTRITKAIRDGGFFTNPALIDAVDKAQAAGGAVHIMGLLSPGGVHSHEDHLIAMVNLAVQRGAQQVFVHAFLDGRDTPPRSAESSLTKMRDHLARVPGKNGSTCRIATIVGRYYAMDRDNRWERVEAAYRLLTEASANFRSADPVQALMDAYGRGENDEFVQPTVIAGTDEKPAFIRDGDSVVLMNFRADRARQISRAFVQDDFRNFARRARPKLAAYVMLTEYAADIRAACAYPPSPLTNVLGEYLAKLGKTQLRIAETEKYAHVTFFFNGGREEPFAGEDRILVPSPQVATYDLQPQMSAPEVTDKLIEAIMSGKYDVIVCNYANGDMVGHTGIFTAAVQAAEAIDVALGRLVAAVESSGGRMLITADHGNIEQMHDNATRQAHTAHTSGPVPLIYVGDKSARVQPVGGVLADIAPTMLTLMGIPVPAEMTGHVLVRPGH
ncbi:MAG: 2,3-bisphosphoglycerate-independent phosphoglycerate mutase [Pseudomonadota bacterium]